jgi:hypothetical protein
MGGADSSPYPFVAAESRTATAQALVERRSNLRRQGIASQNTLAMTDSWRCFLVGVLISLSANTDLTLAIFILTQ